MKPLSEWTEKELREWLLFPPYNSGPNADDILAELLRRERERCAAECDAVRAEKEKSTADQKKQGWDNPGSEWEAWAAEECAAAIRSLS